MLKRVVLLMALAAVMFAAAPAVAQDMMMPHTLNLGGGNSDLGPFIVAANGMTLYTFKRDTFGVSNCTGNCANAWPPYTVESADGLSVAEGIPGEVGTIERPDGTLQVTYNGMPLYFWMNDAEVGDANGHNVRTLWSVVRPATVYAVPHPEHGFMLVGERGFTLYTFANDAPGVSNCLDACANNWPPLTVSDPNALITAINLPGIFGTIERPDGKLQVTYNNKPLYYWVQDMERGDTTGHLRNNVWFVALP
jgi:predicted lipoprotein with Yx(FWY)xxD motif